MGYWVLKANPFDAHPNLSKPTHLTPLYIYINTYIYLVIIICGDLKEIVLIPLYVYLLSFFLFSRDYVDSGYVYITPDSGGECGVAYETYFPMPTPAKDKPWYSIEQASVHFTVISTEHDWSVNSEQVITKRRS